jgi:hypothetical protein
MEFAYRKGRLDEILAIKTMAFDRLRLIKTAPTRKPPFACISVYYFQ